MGCSCDAATVVAAGTHDGGRCASQDAHLPVPQHLGHLHWPCKGEAGRKGGGPCAHARRQAGMAWQVSVFEGRLGQQA